MNRPFRIALLIFTAIWLSGCELVLAPAMLLSIPGPSGAVQDFEPETAIRSNDLVSVKTIALLEIPEPPNYGRDPGFALENAEHGGVNFSDTTRVSLKNYLEENGFAVIECSPNRENEHRLIYDYSSLDIKGADAYLDVVPIEVEYNYFADIRRPHVSISFRLISADSLEKIYAGSIRYGKKDWMAQSAGVEIESTEGHRYETSEALKANKKEASEWLVQGIEAVSLSIGKNIVEGKLAGIAAKELDTESYDENLWAKALKEAEGDETKQKIKYIELRTSQLYSENASSVSASTICEKSTTSSEQLSLQQTGVYDLSGIYTSEITSNSFIKTQKYQEFNLEIRRLGNEISGTIGGNVANIYGTINGDVIKFNVSASAITKGYSLEGSWKVSSDGKRVTGKWGTQRYGSGGKWNLTRVE